MTTAAIQYPYAGSQPLGNSSSFIEVADNDVSYKPITPVGTIIDFSDPFYGGGRAIRLCVPKNTTAIKVGTIAIWSAATNAGFLSNFSYVIAPVTASQARPCAIAINAVPLNATAVQYAWFMVIGTAPLLFNAAAATTDKAWISASAGVAFVTLTAGRQIMPVSVVVASTGTVVKTNVRIVSGSPIIVPSNSDGLFVGQSVSGTGITTSLITAISVEGAGPSVTLASNSTASGQTTATATLNDGTSFFPICQFGSLYLQGNVT